MELDFDVIDKYFKEYINNKENKMKKINNYTFEDIKEQLKHVYFINGTAYAGKSTVCKMLSEQYDMFHCEENYITNYAINQTTKETHPNIHYFETMSGWEEFVCRNPYTYAKWLEDTALETTPFEIEYLLSLPKSRKVIVDTNIPHHILSIISDYKRVAYMVTTPEISRDEFFNRGDKEKQFLLNVINNTSNKEETLQNFKDMLLCANSEDVIKRFVDTGYFCIYRKRVDEDVVTKFEEIRKHFDLKYKENKF